MRNTTCNTACRLLYERVAETELSEQERLRALHALRVAEAVADAVLWVAEGIAALGVRLPRLGFKH